MRQQLGTDIACQTRQAVFLTSGMFLAQYAAAFPLRLLPILAPVVSGVAGFSEALVGYLAATVSIGALTGSLFVGRLEARFTAVGTLQLTMLLSALAALCMTQPSVWAFFLGCFLAGLADGPTPAAGSADLQRCAPDGLRSTLFSAKMLGGSLGGMSAGLAFPYVAGRWGWEFGPWLAAGVALGVLCYLSMTATVWPRPAPHIAPRRGWKFAVPKLPYARRLAAIGAIMSVTQGVWFAYYVSFLVRELGHSVAFAGAMVSVSLFSVVMSRVGLALLADVTGQGQRILALVCLSAGLPWLGLCITTPQTPQTLIVALSVLFGATVGGWVGLQHAELARTTPNENLADATGFATTLMFLGLALSGVIFSSVITVTRGFVAGFAGLAALSLITGGYQLAKPIPVNRYQ